MTMEPTKFTCAICGKEFTSLRSDEEAVAELKSNFPTAKLEDCAVVCEWCYRESLTRAMIHQIARLN